MRNLWKMIGVIVHEYVVGRVEGKRSTCNGGCRTFTFECSSLNDDAFRHRRNQLVSNSCDGWG